MTTTIARCARAAAAIVCVILGLPPAGAQGAGQVLDQGRLEYRLQGQPCGHEDFVVEKLGDRIVWRSSSLLDLGEVTIGMQVHASYDAITGTPTMLREYRGVVDGGKATAGKITITGEFGGGKDQLTIEHRLLGRLVPEESGGALSSSHQTVLVVPILDEAGAPLDDLVALDSNGGYVLYGAVAAMAPSTPGASVQRRLIIPTAEKTAGGQLASQLRIKLIGQRGAARQVELETAGARFEVRVSGQGYRLEKVSVPDQQFEAVRISDRAKGEPGKAVDPPPEEQPIEEQLQIPVAGGFLAGTLRRPHGGPAEGRVGVPAALILSEAGPQDRNGNEGSKAGPSLPAVLADALAARGIASLRVDDPGVGESTGSLATRDLRTLVDDAARCFKQLQALEGIDRRRVAVIGHGEGGQIAPLLAAEQRLPVAALVLVGAPSLPLNEMSTERATQRMRSLGTKDQAIAERLRPRRLVFDLLRGASSWEELRLTGNHHQAEDGYLAGELEEWKGRAPLAYYQQHFDQEPRVMILLANTPTLFVAGGSDRVIPPSHSRELARVLDQAGRIGHQLWILPYLDHHLARPGEILADEAASHRIASWIGDVL